MKKVMISLVGLLTLFLTTGIRAQTSSAAGERGVSVIGSASQVLQPDRVVIQITVENYAKTAKEAQKLTSESVSRVLAYLKTKNNIRSVETNFVSLRPRRIDYNKEEYDYTAVQNIAFVLTEIGDYQNVIIDLLDRGVNGLGQVVFESSQRENIEQQLLAAAVRNAREKAKFLAGQLDQEVGRAVYISDHLDQSGPVPIQFRSGLKMEAQDVIAPGELKVNAEVSITFELK